MNWNKLIEEIISTGISEVRLAEKLKVSQMTINRIRRGQTDNPIWPLGNGIIEVHRELCGVNDTV